MVVDQVDVVGIAIFEAEDHPPVAGNRDASVPLQFTLQRVKPVAGQVEVRGFASIVKVRQGERDPIRQGGTHSARIAALVHALQAAMTKPSDHEAVCRIPVHMSIGKSRRTATSWRTPKNDCLPAGTILDGSDPQKGGCRRCHTACHIPPITVPHQRQKTGRLYTLVSEVKMLDNGLLNTFNIFNSR